MKGRLAASCEQKSLASVRRTQVILQAPTIRLNHERLRIQNGGPPRLFYQHGQMLCCLERTREYLLKDNVGWLVRCRRIQQQVPID